MSALFFSTTKREALKSAMVSLAPGLQLLLGCVVLLSLNTEIEVFTEAYLMGIGVHYSQNL